MDEWMDGGWVVGWWVGGWMDGWMDGWVDGCISERSYPLREFKQNKENGLLEIRIFC
jgi:hypothetical protein